MTQRPAPSDSQPRVEPFDRFDLTKRELDILLGLADGLSNKEIAVELNRSVGTAREHVAHLLYKFSARNRTHLVALAYHHGILKPRPS